jgi:hypothetical protein
MPERIQRERVKGWRKPNGAVYVGRPTIYGNPFTAARRCTGCGGFGNLPVWPDLGVTECEDCTGTGSGREQAVNRFALWIAADTLNPQEWEGHLIAAHVRVSAALKRGELVGRDLVCWCPPDQPCHADVLLEIANGGGQDG